ncbi:MAG: reverse transcriptase domain-containing protein, partial [Flavobacterium sp.]
MDRIEQIIDRAWTMDTLGIKDKARSPGQSKNFKRPESEWSPQEMAVEAEMIVDFIPAKEGDPAHATCKIPWVDGGPNLKNNLNPHINRQRSTNSDFKVEGKGTQASEIEKIMKTMEEKGYIKEISDPNEINRPDCYYINYMYVVDKGRETTKVRTVFDAAAKDKFGISLNSQVKKGPNRLNDLFSILLRFRRFKYAVTADISEMFLRIRLTEEDQRYHRFWYNEKIYQWTRTLFGNRASPDMSQKVLQTHATNNMDKFPNAALAILIATYMDDTITSLEFKKKIIELIEELIPLVAGLDMKIMKFYSNCKEAL